VCAGLVLVLADGDGEADGAGLVLAGGDGDAEGAGLVLADGEDVADTDVDADVDGAADVVEVNGTADGDCEDPPLAGG
jgi:hypothetical protein